MTTITTTTTSPRRLDMKHGFINLIIRNQIDRDEYDKAVKLNRQNSDCEYVKAKEARNLYIPPPLRQLSINSPAKRHNLQNVENDPNDPYNEMRKEVRKRIYRKNNWSSNHTQSTQDNTPTSTNHHHDQKPTPPHPLLSQTSKDISSHLPRVLLNNIMNMNLSTTPMSSTQPNKSQPLHKNEQSRSENSKSENEFPNHVRSSKQRQRRHSSRRKVHNRSKSTATVEF